MASTAGVTYTAKQGFLNGTYQSTDVYKIALYTSAATLAPSTTTVYTSSGEVVGTGYTAGGATLSGITVNISSGTAYLTWANPSWTTSTLTGVVTALIYDSTAANAAIAILTFASTSTTAGTFTVVLPAAGASSTVTIS
jgi:hypothetical protein